MWWFLPRSPVPTLVKPSRSTKNDSIILSWWLAHGCHYKPHHLEPKPRDPDVGCSGVEPWQLVCLITPWGDPHMQPGRRTPPPRVLGTTSYRFSTWAHLRPWSQPASRATSSRDSKATDWFLLRKEKQPVSLLYNWLMSCLAAKKPQTKPNQIHLRWTAGTHGNMGLNISVGQSRRKDASKGTVEF